MSELQKAVEAARGLAYLVKHAPESTPLIEVGALINLVANAISDAADAIH